MSITWDDERDAEFRRLRLARTPVAEMALTFGTTVGAIYAHARVLKAFVIERKEWSAPEVADLERMDDADVSIREMARRLGRTEQSVSWKLGDVGRSAKRMRYWRDDDARLRALLADEVSIEAIALELGRSVDAVRDRMGALGMLDSKRRWEDEEVLRLREAVARDDGIEAIAKDLARDVGSVRAKAYALGLKFSGPERVLTPGEIEGLRAALRGKNGMVKYAASIGVGVRWLRRRAREAGVEVQTRRRSPLDEAARAAIVEAANSGMAITVAVKELGRDARTLKRVAEEEGTAFAVPVPTPKVRIVRLRTSRLAVPREAAAKPVVRAAPVVRVSTARVPVAAVPVAAPNPRGARAGTPAWGNRRRASNAPPMDKAALDAAVARFMAVRSVAREAIDPVEEAVRAIRRRGYAVVRVEGDFVVDGRTRLADAKGLASFAAARGIAVPAALGA